MTSMERLNKTITTYNAIVGETMPEEAVDVLTLLAQNNMIPNEIVLGKLILKAKVEEIKGGQSTSQTITEMISFIKGESSPEEAMTGSTILVSTMEEYNMQPEEIISILTSCGMLLATA